MTDAFTGPRAFFACLSKKCRTDDGAPTYELPVKAMRCPVCASKRIQRVWSGPESVPGTLRPGARDLQKMIDVTGADAFAQRDAGRDARLNAQKRRESPQLAKPLSYLTGLGIRVAAGESRPAPELAPHVRRVALGAVAGAAPRVDFANEMTRVDRGSADAARAAITSALKKG